MFTPPPYEGSVAWQESQKDLVIPLIETDLERDIGIAAARMAEIKRAGGTVELFLTIRARQA